VVKNVGETISKAIIYHADSDLERWVGRKNDKRNPLPCEHVSKYLFICFFVRSFNASRLILTESTAEKVNGSGTSVPFKTEVTSPATPSGTGVKEGSPSFPPFMLNLKKTARHF